jgi:WD40 repeat protein
MIDSSIYTVGGTVQAGGGVYIPRAADEDLLELCRLGAFAYVLTARQMGKSSLMTRTAERLAAEDIRSVLLDLTRLGTQLSAEQWYLGLMVEIADQLALTTDPIDWWQLHAHLGLTQRLTDFLQTIVLVEIDARVVIFVDEIDTTLSLDFTDDFYAAIRALYNARAQEPDLARLAFVLIGVALPGDLIKDPQRTPFNIGQEIILTDFTLAEAQPFADGLGLPPAQAQQVLAVVFGWTSGHPYLTQRLCAVIARARRASWITSGIDRLVAETFFGEKSKQDNNLQFVRDMLTRRATDPAGVLTAYGRIWRGGQVKDDERSLVLAQLKLAGIVRRKQATLHVANNIYQAVFDKRWVHEHLPRQYWTRRAQRAGLALVAALAVLVALLGVFLVGANSRVDELQQALAQRAAAEQTAEARGREAEAQALAFRGLTVPDREVGLLLAIEAARRVERGEVSAGRKEIEDVLRQSLLWFPPHVDLPGSRFVSWSPDGQRILAMQHENVVIKDGFDGHTLFTLNTGYPTSAVWSPDGRRVVTHGASGAESLARVWDAMSGRELMSLRGRAKQSDSVLWSPDGQRLVTFNADHTASLWDAASGRELMIIRGKGGGIRSEVSWSPDGQRLAMSAYDGTTSIWDTLSGSELTVLHGYVPALAWSPDGRKVVTIEGSMCRVWDAASGRELAAIPGDASTINGSVWSPDGLRIATLIKADNRLVVWDVASGRELQTMSSGAKPLGSWIWSPDGQRILIVTYDNTASVWDASSGQELVTLQTDASGATDIGNYQSTASWSPDGRQIAMDILYPQPRQIAMDFTLYGVSRIWDAASGRELATLPGMFTGVGESTWSSDGQRLLTTNSDTAAYVWDIAGVREPALLRSQSKNIVGAQWSPDGRRFLTFNSDDTTSIWDTASARELVVLKGLASGGGRGSLMGEYAAWSPDGQRVVTLRNYEALITLRNYEALIWDAASGKQLARLRHGNIFTAAWSPDGRSIMTTGRVGKDFNETAAIIWDAASGRERAVAFQGRAWPVWSPNAQHLLTFDDVGRVWDVISERAVARFQLPGDPGIDNVLWSPDGQQIIISGVDGTIRSWDIASGREIVRLRQGQSIVGWSQDRKWVATRSRNPYDVLIWELASERNAVVLRGHSDTVWRSTWSPDGQRIVTVSVDGTARMWDAASGRELAVLRGHARNVLSATWSPDGRRILMVGSDGTARIYYANLADLLALAESRVTRQLTSLERQSYGLAQTPAPTSITNVAYPAPIDPSIRLPIATPASYPALIRPSPASSSPGRAYPTTQAQPLPRATPAAYPPPVVLSPDAPTLPPKRNGN